jgi:alkanesulfonate monooxygenase SsuD/methylene tetrahydromethanopterin reductase-like flavin-dependent oxidoreductase (luciferase family)
LFEHLWLAGAVWRTMEHQMQFGIFGGAKVSTDALDTGLSGDSLGLKHFVDYVRSADELGFSHLFMVEHHFTGAQQVSSSLALLTYLAALTKRIRLGTGVIVLPWHNPALLAEDIAALDLLSNGRFDLGIGRGYRPIEFKGFGMPFEEAAERFEEAFAFLRKALSSEERFTHTGKYWNFNDVVIEPRSVQRPTPPFWMAGSSPETIRRAARENLNLLIDQVGSIDLTLERLEVYRSEKARLGIAYDPSQVAVTRGMRITATEADGRTAVSDMATLLDKAGVLKFAKLDGVDARQKYIESDAAMMGTTEQIVRQIERLGAGGVEILLLADVTGNSSSLRVFAEEIFPLFPTMRASAGAVPVAPVQIVSATRKLG